MANSKVTPAGVNPVVASLRSPTKAATILADAAASGLCIIDRLPDRNEIGGTPDALRDSGYAGCFPDEVGLTKKIGASGDPVQSIRRVSSVSYCWTIHLNPEEIKARHFELDSMDGRSDNSRIMCGHFTKDKLLLCLASSIELEDMAVSLMMPMTKDARQDLAWRLRAIAKAQFELLASKSASARTARASLAEVGVTEETVNWLLTQHRH